MSGPGHNRRAGDLGSAESALQIGLVPLIDLSLTLVVVFLVFMPMALTSLIPIASAPAAASGPASEAKEAPILMEVEASRVRVGPVTFESELALTAWLRDGAASRRDRSLTVKVSPDVKQDRLIQVLDWVRLSGDWKMTLMTLKDSGDESGGK